MQWVMPGFSFTKVFTTGRLITEKDLIVFCPPLLKTANFLLVFPKSITRYISADKLHALMQRYWKFKNSFYFCTPISGDGVVAQMVEQRTENPCVTGSIPVDATKIETLNIDYQLVRGFFMSNWASFGQQLIRNYTELFRTTLLSKSTSTELFS